MSYPQFAYAVESIWENSLFSQPEANPLEFFEDAEKEQSLAEHLGICFERIRWEGQYHSYSNLF